MISFKNIKLLAMDVDGTLTDGAMVWCGDEQIKFYNAKDGLGIRLCGLSGIIIAWITGNSSRAVTERAKLLKVNKVIDACTDKASALAEVSIEFGIPMEEIAFIGDDLNDLPAIKKAGIGIAVKDAVSEIINAADYVTKAHGGKGAVREISELILKEQGKWEDIVKNFEKYEIYDKSHTIIQ